MNARLTFITLLIYVSVAMAIFFTVKNSGDNPVYAAVFPRVITAGNYITYRDSTPNAKSYMWEFGNGTGNKKFKATGTYTFLKPGTFLMRLFINNKLADTFRITVKPRPEEESIDSSFSIYAPETGLAGEKIPFKVFGNHIESYKWSFGESGGKVDNRDAVAFHTYSKAGDYDVKLTTNLGTVFHKIKIKEPYTPVVNVNKNIGGGSEAPDLRQSIQKLVGSGETFNEKITFLANTFLCGNKSVAVTVNGKSEGDLYLYGQDLRKDASKQIESVKTENDPTTNCIKRLIINAH
jgi:hypothetical protein